MTDPELARSIGGRLVGLDAEDVVQIQRDVGDRFGRLDRHGLPDAVPPGQDGRQRGTRHERDQIAGLGRVLDIDADRAVAGQGGDARADPRLGYAGALQQLTQDGAGFVRIAAVAGVAEGGKLTLPTGLKLNRVRPRGA